MGGGAEVGLPAAAAAQLAGEQVVGGVGAARGGVFAALLEDPLCPLEQMRLDERLVGGVVPLAAVVDLAEVGAVANDGEHALAAPRSALPGAVPVLVEPAGDRGGAELAVGVEVEDARHERRLGRVGVGGARGRR